MFILPQLKKKKKGWYGCKDGQLDQWGKKWAQKETHDSLVYDRRDIKISGEKSELPNEQCWTTGYWNGKINYIPVSHHKELNYSQIILWNYERPNFKAIRKNICGDICMMSVEKISWMWYEKLY